MESVLFRVLVITSVCGLSAKHVFISTSTNWWRAQQYCRTHFTDLSPITSEDEDNALKSASEGRSGWIGLYKEFNSQSLWRWSGGHYMTYQNWIYESASYAYSSSYVGYWSSGGWYSISGYSNSTFFCLDLIVPQVKKSWEEALEHCREHHDDLMSLESETPRLLALRRIQQSNITERVWISLRYVGSSWLWVNSEPLESQAWSQGDQDHQCPIWKRCGAFTKGGLWESWDCNEKLNFICV